MGFFKNNMPTIFDEIVFEGKRKITEKTNKLCHSLHLCLSGSNVWKDFWHGLP